mgnify:CR=1 FL=1
MNFSKKIKLLFCFFIFIENKSDNNENDNKNNLNLNNKIILGLLTTGAIYFIYKKILNKKSNNYKNDEKFMYQKKSDSLKRVNFIVQTTDLKEAYEEDKILDLEEAKARNDLIKDLVIDETIEFPRIYRKDIA